MKQSIMSLSKMGGRGQIWNFQKQEDNEHCIYQEYQGQRSILMGLDKCFVEKYDEDIEQEQDDHYMWVI